MNNQEDFRDVVDAEVVKDVPGNRKARFERYTFKGKGGQPYSFGRAWSYTSYDVGMTPSTLISIILFFFCLFKWGVLAALGFFVFHVISIPLRAYYTVLLVIYGGFPNFWLQLIVAWGINLLLVSWLAS